MMPRSRRPSAYSGKCRKSIGVPDVARHAGFSRCVLERSFQETFDRSPGEEIRRMGIRTGQATAVDTDLPIPDVAERSGFGLNAYFTDCFQRANRNSPLRYRKKMRNR